MKGFVLVELVILLNVVAVCGLMAIAPPLPNDTSANEKKAIAVLRDLVRQQNRFKAGAFMDEDLDGRGEFGSLGELSGLVNLVRNGVGVAAPLNPPLLPTWCQSISSSGYASASGYLFVVYLPNATIPPIGHADVWGGGPSGQVDPNNCEQLWCAYAWPVSTGTTGNRTFFVNQAGMILQTHMTTTAYGGAGAAVPYSSAFIASGMSFPLALPPVSGTDGNDWVPVP